MSRPRENPSKNFLRFLSAMLFLRRRSFIHTCLWLVSFATYLIQKQNSSLPKFRFHSMEPVFKLSKNVFLIERKNDSQEISLHFEIWAVEEFDKFGNYRFLVTYHYDFDELSQFLVYFDLQWTKALKSGVKNRFFLFSIFARLILSAEKVSKSLKKALFLSKCIEQF